LKAIKYCQTKLHNMFMEYLIITFTCEECFDP
jgi:hypothetical protein